jgi:hypothetical protein
MRTDIVIVFLTILFLTFVFIMFRYVFRAGGDWGEYILEWASRKRPAGRLLHGMENKPRGRLIEIALALALAPYHWPTRRDGADEGLLRARERYLEFFASLSDDDLQQWTKEKIRDTHSLLLKVALESLSDEGSSGQKRVDARFH